MAHSAITPLGLEGGRLPKIAVQKPPRRFRSQLHTKQRALPGEVTFALSQQAFAFSAVFAVENLYTRWRLPANDPGQPPLLPLAVISGGYGATVGLLQTQNEVLQIVAFLTGIATSVFVVAASATRISNTKSDPSRWPGPKAGPVLLSLGASSIALALIQSLSRLSA